MSAKGKKIQSPVGVDELSFEAALAELETLVVQLEAGELPLEAALAVFERGQALAVRCGRLLDAAELKVQVAAPRAGGAVLEPFSDED